ncbi:uncharacterized protein BDW43DRAFT_272879 [Aspergillus alliaceus]|uniref:uncharacterized protein n=1 Tax=Petromyces alliaceus TaxID=209559 RepID=UPI0012A6C857|nr:uncharacterized protein BDW43DRAFT_272879 [Aspergillus alliaceus]KAB8234768.1 hypothetical protein BDW43DRAFT_272879 [Aspergillus alliaceus]
MIERTGGRSNEKKQKTRSENFEFFKNFTPRRPSQLRSRLDSASQVQSGVHTNALRHTNIPPGPIRSCESASGAVHIMMPNPCTFIH